VVLAIARGPGAMNSAETNLKEPGFGKPCAGKPLAGFDEGESSAGGLPPRCARALSLYNLSCLAKVVGKSVGPGTSVAWSVLIGRARRLALIVVGQLGLVGDLDLSELIGAAQRRDPRDHLDAGFSG
jgi:hypothetical protein